MNTIFGFTLLRNGLKYDYPFRESLTSLLGLAKEVWLTLGNSEDGTEQALAQFAGLRILPTVWDEELRKDGVILSQQTNAALEFLRRDHSSGWAFYLQADEVLLETEYAAIRADLARAELEGCDAVSFRWVHFWQRYDRIAYARRWYPEEVRAIRLDAAIESFADAQGFRGQKKVFRSNCHVFHYGHVREPSAYEVKKNDFHRWWHNDEEMKKRQKKASVSDAQEPTLAWLGPHPKCMEARIGVRPSLPRKNILIFGTASDLPEGFQARVNADLTFTLQTDRVLSANPQEVILLRHLPLWARLWAGRAFRSQVPKGMLWKGCRPWDPEFHARLLFSEKGVSSTW